MEPVFDLSFSEGPAVTDDGNRVHLQNWLVFTEQRPTAFDPYEADGFVGERETVSEDGEPISEWHVSLADVRAFAERRSAERTSSCLTFVLSFRRPPTLRSSCSV